MLRNISRLHSSRLLRPLSLTQIYKSETLNPPSLSYLCVSSPLKTSPPLPSHLPCSSYPFFCRPFSSSPSSSSVVLIGSEEGFNKALNRVQDEKGHAIFYFTATWCGPCKFISPVIEEMGKKFPDVAIYKIDIDQEGLGSTLNNLKISAVIQMGRNGTYWSSVRSLQP